MKYLLIDAVKFTDLLREKHSRKAAVARALIHWENGRMAWKQANAGCVVMNEHERFGGKPKLHFTPTSYMFLPLALRDNFTYLEWKKAMELLKQKHIAWMFARKKRGVEWMYIHAWNLENDSRTSVFDFDGSQFTLDEHASLFNDYDECGKAGPRASRDTFLQLALAELAH